MDDEKLRSLRVLHFTQPDARWLRFVVANRQGTPQTNEWDLIHGPVANDQTMPIIDLFLDGMYDEDEAIRRLLPQKLKDQYAFKTQAAIQLLRFVKAITI